MSDSGRRVLVTGASGNLGREVLRVLRRNGIAVRALVHRAPPPAGMDTVVGELTDPVVLRRALEGTDAVFLVWPLVTVDGAASTVRALVAAGPRVVYVSSNAIDEAADRQSDPIVAVHAEMEALLRAARAPLSVLRSDTLASNARGWQSQIRSGDVVRGPVMPRTAIVDERDVAEVAAAVLATDEHVGAMYRLTGPEALDRAAQVSILGVELGRELRFEPMPADAVRRRLVADGRPDRLIDALIAASEHRPESSLVTPDVELLLGRPAGSFAHWVRDHRDEFGAPRERRTPAGIGTPRGDPPSRP